MSEHNDTKHQQILALERFLPYRLSILSNLISGILADTYKDKFALTITEWRIMAVLGECAGISADEISAKINIEKSIISRALQKLLSRHLVSREVDKVDRRRQNLNLTKVGLEIYQQLVPVAYSYENELLRCFSEEEQTQFNALLDRLYQHADTVQLTKSDG